MHTPGPWSICEDPPNPSWIKGVTVSSDTVGKRVADVCYLNSDYEADACLIAAAPELLMALQAVLAEWREGYGLNCIEQVRRAISNATKNCS